MLKRKEQEATETFSGLKKKIFTAIFLSFTFRNIYFITTIILENHTYLDLEMIRHKFLHFWEFLGSNFNINHRTCQTNAENKHRRACYNTEFPFIVIKTSNGIIFSFWFFGRSCRRWWS